MTPDKILVIGYGNDLMGDDAAGPQVAATVEKWALPHVRVIIRHQLTPELAEPISAAGAVIFIDASVEITGDTAQAQPVEPDYSVNLMAHSGEPAALLALAQTIYGKHPPTWCIHIPAQTFELGAPFSLATAHAMPTALAEIKALYQRITRETVRP